MELRAPSFSAGEGLLPNLLIAALQRAVAFAEMNDAATAVAQDLNLDVARRVRYFSI
jgi:hypothetical protein